MLALSLGGINHGVDCKIHPLGLNHYKTRFIMSARRYAGGDVSYVQVWDANTESRCQKIDTTVAACLTSLCVLPDSNGLLGMGFGNGKR